MAKFKWDAKNKRLVDPSYIPEEERVEKTLEQMTLEELQEVAVHYGVELPFMATKEDAYSMIMQKAGYKKPDFEEMTVEQLKQYAAEKQIDISAVKLKPEIIALLTAAAENM